MILQCYFLAHKTCFQWQCINSNDKRNQITVDNDESLLHLAWVRTSVDLVGSRVLPVMNVQVDVEGLST